MNLQRLVIDTNQEVSHNPSLENWDKKKTCIASLFPAWEPPLMTLNAGTGRTTCLVPANWAMCLYKGIPLCTAPALHTANDTPRIAFAPRLATNIIITIVSNRYYLHFYTSTDEESCFFFKVNLATNGLLKNHTARETKRLPLFSVPSNSSKNLSISICWITSKP